MGTHALRDVVCVFFWSFFAVLIRYYHDSFVQIEQRAAEKSREVEKREREKEKKEKGLVEREGVVLKKTRQQQGGGLKKQKRLQKKSSSGSFEVVELGGKRRPKERHFFCKVLTVFQHFVGANLSVFFFILLVRQLSSLTSQVFLFLFFFFFVFFDCKKKNKYLLREKYGTNL